MCPLRGVCCPAVGERSMEMPQVNEIRIDATTTALLDEIRLAAEKVNDIRPLSCRAGAP